MMMYSESESENTNGSQHEQQQDRGLACQEDKNGENLWDTFELLQIDLDCESTGDQFTRNENWCSVCMVHCEVRK